MSATVTTQRHGRVLVATIDDGKANAFSAEVLGALSSALDEAERDEQIGALAILGRPGKFSGGFDLSVMRSGDVAAIVNLVSDGGDLVRRLYGSPVPVVGGCTGHAVAAGALVLLGCDVRVGADVECKIGLNEVAIGMVLPEWAFTLAEARLNPGAYQVAVVTAALFGASDAVRAGYLDEVVPAGDHTAAVISRAEGLASLDRRAYAATLRRVRGSVLARMDEQIAHDRAHVTSPLV